MKILVVTKDLPYPLDQGGKIRSYYLLRELSKENQVTLVSLKRSRGELPEEALAFLSALHPIDAPRGFFRKVCDLLQSVLGARPYTVVANTDKRLRDTLSALLSHEEFDIVLIEELYVVENLPEASQKIPKVLDCMNIEHLVLERLAQSAENAVARIWYRFNAAAMKRLEIRTCRSMDALIAVSQKELSYFRQYNEVCIVAPNGVEGIHNCKAIRREQLLFIGSLEYPPNAEGLLYFLQNIWPQIRSHRPSCSLAIVAKRPSARLLEHSGNGVTFFAEVESAASFFEQSACLIVPLYAGGGTRIKVLEAFSYGLPVVTTSIGVEGIEARDPQHLYVRDSAERFKDAVLEILSTPAEARKRAQNAQRLVQEQYLWKSTAEKLSTLFAEISGE